MKKYINVGNPFRYKTYKIIKELERSVEVTLIGITTGFCTKIYTGHSNWYKKSFIEAISNNKIFWYGE